MKAQKSTLAGAVIELFRVAFEAAEKLQGAEREQVVGAVTAHLRSLAHDDMLAGTLSAGGES